MFKISHEEKADNGERENNYLNYSDGKTVWQAWLSLYNLSLLFI